MGWVSSIAAQTFATTFKRSHCIAAKREQNTVATTLVIIASILASILTFLRDSTVTVDKRTSSQRFLPFFKPSPFPGPRDIIRQFNGREDLK